MGLFSKNGDDKKEIKRKQVQEEAKGYIEYTRMNINHICDIINKLKFQTIELIETYKKAKAQKFGLVFKGKEGKKNKELAEQNIKYLYLIKDYFITLSKLHSGIKLKTQQSELIIKVAPFFDGKDILSEGEDEIEEYERKRGILDSFNKMEVMLREKFLTNKSELPLDLNSYLEDNYSKDIENLIIPDIDNAILTFKNIFAMKNEPYILEPINNEKVNTSNQDNYKNETQNVTPIINIFNGMPSQAQEKIVKEDNEIIINDDKVICQNCNAKINKSAKFCPECGNKNETKKQSFCTECGAQIEPNIKFCTNCGNKIE